MWSRGVVVLGLCPGNSLEIAVALVVGFLPEKSDAVGVRWEKRYYPKADRLELGYWKEQPVYSWELVLALLSEVEWLVLEK